MNGLGISTTLIVANRLSIVVTAKKIYDYLKINDISIVHSHLLNSDLIAAILKMLFYPKLILISTKHGYQEKILQQYEPGKPIHLKGLYYYITRFTLKKIDYNITISKGMSDFFVNLNITKIRYPFIYHGVNIEDFEKDLYLPDCRKANVQIIIVGRIELFKGHYFIIEALPEIIKFFPTLKLLVLGEGSEKGNCIAQVASLGLQEHVEFLGFQPHPYSYISNSDVIILPSHFEPFGLVYIESFALKTPVIAFDTAAGNEIIKNNETGILVPMNDTKSLAQKTIYLLEHPEERKKIAENAYNRFLSYYTTERMVDETAAWYHSLM
jgi:glycosyltransferase involved in cell wall biosynthesis